MLRCFRPRNFSALAVAAGISLVTASASAQSAKELARARERFKEAAALQSAGDFARALDAYKEVALVKSSATVRFNIATCEEKTGDYVRAMGSYRLALTEATRSNAKDIESAVQRALADLEPRIPMLIVKRGDGAEGASISIDERPLAAPSVGVEFALNPGPHRVTATAPDHEPFAMDITVSDNDHKSVEVVLKKKVAPPPPPVPVPPSPPTAGETPPGGDDTTPPPPPPDDGKVLLGVGVATTAAGVISLIVSGAFFAKRQSAISTLTMACGPTGMSCPSSDQSVYNSGKSDASVSTGTLVFGLVAVVAGGTMTIVGARKGRAAAPVTPPPEQTGFVLAPSGPMFRF